jgi:hypothetical protein
VGRKLLYPVRITLPLSKGMIAALDIKRGVTKDNKEGDRDRVSCIREALEEWLRKPNATR